MVKEVKFGQKFVTGKVKSQNIILGANETNSAYTLFLTHSGQFFLQLVACLAMICNVSLAIEIL